MNQTQLDDNGMMVDAPVRFIFKDIETGEVKAEIVPYKEANDVITGKASGSKMVQLPKSGWIEAFSIKKFYSLSKPQESAKRTVARKFDFNLADILWSPEKVDNPGAQFTDFLESETKRVNERTEITGIKDPRSKLYPRILSQPTHAARVEMYKKTVNEPQC